MFRHFYHPIHIFCTFGLYVEWNEWHTIHIITETSVDGRFPRNVVTSYTWLTFFSIFIAILLSFFSYVHAGR